MTVEAFYTAEELRHLIAAGSISSDALQSIVGVDPLQLREFLDGAPPAGLTSQPSTLSGDESARLSILAAQLTEGLQIGDDERLVAIYESLTTECRLTLANIAQLTGLEIDDLERVMRDPSTLTFQTRYELAIKGSYLINAVNRARGR